MKCKHCGAEGSHVKTVSPFWMSRDGDPRPRCPVASLPTPDLCDFCFGLVKLQVHKLLIGSFFPPPENP